MFDKEEAEHVLENGLGLLDVRTIQQAVVEADRGNALFGVGAPGFRIKLAHIVADGSLLRIQLDIVAGRQREANALAGFQQFAGRNTLGGDAIGVQILFQLDQRRIAIDLEREEINAGRIGLTQDHAVVIALFPGLEINTALGIATGFDQAQHLRIKLNAFFNVEYPHLRVSGTKYACHCHLSAPLFWMW